MAVNYNFLKSLKGTAIGTIVPWTGDISQIPAGWLQCNAQTLDVNSFPSLYEVIGNKYGGVLNVDFKLPNIQAKSIVDYHTSHENIYATALPQKHLDLIDDENDVANEANFVRTSEIDLFAYYNAAVNNMLGFVTETELNDPVYFDGLSSSGRAMGDHHIGTHGHPGAFDVTAKPNQWAERCQTGGFYNCAFFGCEDQCGSPQFNRTEANNPTDDRQRIGYFEDDVPFVGSAGQTRVGTYLAKPSDGFQGVGGWAERRDPGQNGSTNYNYVDSNNMDTEESVLSPWSYAAVDTSTKFVNFLNSGQENMDAHVHPTQFFEITKGSMNTPATIILNNVSRGNLQPVNDALTGIGVISANTETPNLSIMHIIRAY